MATIDSLPPELLLPILGLLPVPDIRNLSLVCRGIYRVCERPLLKHLIFRTCSTNTPPSPYRNLFRTLHADPSKGSYIYSLRSTGHLSRCNASCTLPALSELPACDAPSDLSFLRAAAKALGFPSDHPLLDSSAQQSWTEAHSHGAWLLLCFYYLPKLRELEFSMGTRELQDQPGFTWAAQEALQQMAEFCARAPSGAAALAPGGALRSVWLGSESETQRYPYHISAYRGQHLQQIVPWLFVPSVEMIRADSVTDRVFLSQPARDCDTNNHAIEDPLFWESELKSLVVGEGRGKSSDVKHILLKAAKLSNESLHQILSVPKALETFVWEHGETGGRSTQKVSPNRLWNSLAMQRDSLKTLVISVGEGAITDNCQVYVNEIEPYLWDSDDDNEEEEEEDEGDEEGEDEEEEEDEDKEKEEDEEKEKEKKEEGGEEDGRNGTGESYDNGTACGGDQYQELEQPMGGRTGLEVRSSDTTKDPSGKPQCGEPDKAETAELTKDSSKDQAIQLSNHEPQPPAPYPPPHDRLPSLSSFTSLSHLALPLSLFTGCTLWSFSTSDLLPDPPLLTSLLPHSLIHLTIDISSLECSSNVHDTIDLFAYYLIILSQLVDVVNAHPRLKRLSVLPRGSNGTRPEAQEEDFPPETWALVQACRKKGVKLKLCGITREKLPWWWVTRMWKDTGERNDLVEEKLERLKEEMKRWWWGGEDEDEWTDYGED